MDNQAMIDKINEYGFETAKVIRYAAYIELQEEGGRKLEVELRLLDLGERVDPELRYSCSVYTQYGDFLVGGNPDPEPETAVDNVHWGQITEEALRLEGSGRPIFQQR